MSIGMGNPDGKVDKMNDEIDSRLWVEHGRAFTDWAAGAIGVIRLSFERLNREQYHAPWRDVPNDCGPRA